MKARSRRRIEARELSTPEHKMSSWRLSRSRSRGKPLPSCRSYLRTLYSLFRYQAHPASLVLAAPGETELVHARGRANKRDRCIRGVYVTMDEQHHAQGRECISTPEYVFEYSSTRQPRRPVENVFCKPKCPRSLVHGILSYTGESPSRRSYLAPYFVDRWKRW